MNNKRAFFFIVTFLAVILVSQSISAYILPQHIVQCNEALARTQDSPITQELLQYKDYYMLGDLITDISVVSYWTIDSTEEDNWWDKIVKTFTFKIGKSYRATHSVATCLRANEIAVTGKERAIAMGICSHQLQDGTSHNIGVRDAIEKTNLYNGLLHSPKEIHDKNLVATAKDEAYSRQVLNLAYEEDVMVFLEKVLVNEPSFSKVNIRAMTDFFVTQYNADTSGNYKLGSQSMFALPTYIYVIIFLLFVLSLISLGSSIRLVKDGEINTPTIFTGIFSLILLVLASLTIYGLFFGSVWSIWEVLSQWLFSPIMYLIGGLLIILGLFIGYRYLKNGNKVKNLPNLFVVLFILTIGIYLLTLPNALNTGNEAQIHELAIARTANLLTQGITYMTNPQIPDPVGYVALKEAQDHGSLVRNIAMLWFIALLGGIVYSTFKRRK